MLNPIAIGINYFEIYHLFFLNNEMAIKPRTIPISSPTLTRLIKRPIANPSKIATTPAISLRKLSAFFCEFIIRDHFNLLISLPCLRAAAKGFGRAPSLKLWRKRPETGRQGTPSFHEGH